MWVANDQTLWIFALKISSTAYLGVPKYPDLEILKIVTTQAVNTCIFELRYIFKSLLWFPNQPTDKDNFQKYNTFLRASKTHVKTACVAAALCQKVTKWNQLQVVNKTYNIDDLLKGDAESEEEGLGLVDDGPLEGVVVNDQIVQQLLLVVAAHRFWKSIIIIKSVSWI